MVKQFGLKCDSSEFLESQNESIFNAREVIRQAMAATDCAKAFLGLVDEFKAQALLTTFRIICKRTMNSLRLKKLDENFCSTICFQVFFATFQVCFYFVNNENLKQFRLFRHKSRSSFFDRILCFHQRLINQVQQRSNSTSRYFWNF